MKGDLGMSSYIDKFIKLSVKAFDAQELGNSRIVNSCNNDIIKIAQKLYQLDKIIELVPLLYHEHVSVRYNAAVKLLPFETVLSEAVLEELASKKGTLTYFSAQLMLKEWRKGNLKFDYYKK